MIEKNEDIIQLEVDNIEDLLPDEEEETEEPATDTTEEDEEEEVTDVDAPFFEPKYELMEETREYNGITLHRIRALKDFGNVHVGQIGGWIETEDNLSHNGSCWVYDRAIVYDIARIWSNAQIRDEAVVCGSADVGDDAKVFNQAKVYDEVLIKGHAMACDSAVVCGRAVIDEYAGIEGCALVRDAYVRGEAKVLKHACTIGCSVDGHAYITDNAIVDTDAHISGFSTLKGDNVLTWYDDPTMIAMLRCSLMSLETKHPFMPDDIEDRADWIEDDGGYIIRKDDENVNLYHVTVYPDGVLELIAEPVDPTVQIQFIDGDTEVDISDDPRITWPSECVGQVKFLYIKVTNPLYPDNPRTFAIEVSIEERPLEPPETPPDEPPVIEPPVIEPVTIMSALEAILGVTNDTIYAGIPTDEPTVYNMTIPPEVDMKFEPLFKSEYYEKDSEYSFEYICFYSNFEMDETLIWPAPCEDVVRIRVTEKDKEGNITDECTFHIHLHVTDEN